MKEIRIDVNMILAGDVGGTKTLLGLFNPSAPRPQSIAIRQFATVEYSDLSAIVSAFVRDEAVRSHAIHAACFGIAGPVLGETAELTNVSFIIDAPAIASALGIS